MQRRLRLLAFVALMPAAFAAAACAGGPPGRSAGKSAARGVVVISIDTLRADHLGCYGYGRDTSPFLDDLAGRGTLFEQAVSTSPWTLPAHASLLSGVYPATHRAVESTEAIATAVPLAAEVFRQAGFATAGIVSSWFVSRRYGFDRGFDHFEDFGLTQQSNNTKKLDAARVVDEAAAWLRQHRQEPFFLFLHFYDPHFNYEPPPEHRLFDTGYAGPRQPYRRYSYYFDKPLEPQALAQEVSLYDGEIHYVDTEIRRLFQVLRQLGREADTLALITADHGEEFFERGSWGHAHTLYDEQIRVPLIMAGAGVAAGQRVTSQVRHVDVLPTLLAAVGQPAPSGIHGRSFWPVALGQAADDGPRPAFLETSRFDSNSIGLRRDQRKFILDLASGDMHLHDLSKDAGEEVDLLDEGGADGAAWRQEALAAAAALIPDRWLLRWFGDGGDQVGGRLQTSGRFVLGRSRGPAGEVRLTDDGQTLSFSLPPGEVLEAAILPVDATVTVPAELTGRRGVLRVMVGREARPIEGTELLAGSHDAALLTGMPTPVPPAAAFWLEQGRGGGGTVHLSEEERQRLESLGYVHAGGDDGGR